MSERACVCVRNSLTHTSFHPFTSFLLHLSLGPSIHLILINVYLSPPLLPPHHFLMPLLHCPCLPFPSLPVDCHGSNQPSSTPSNRKCFWSHNHHYPSSFLSSSPPPYSLVLLAKRHTSRAYVSSTHEGLRIRVPLFMQYSEMHVCLSMLIPKAGTCPWYWCSRVYEKEKKQPKISLGLRHYLTIMRTYCDY